MAHSFLINEGMIYNYRGSDYILKSRRVNDVILENDNGILVITKNECPELFKQLIVG